MKTKDNLVYEAEQKCYFFVWQYFCESPLSYQMNLGARWSHHKVSLKPL